MGIPTAIVAGVEADDVLDPRGGRLAATVGRNPLPGRAPHPAELRRGGALADLAEREAL